MDMNQSHFAAFFQHSGNLDARQIEDGSDFALGHAVMIIIPCHAAQEFGIMMFKFAVVAHCDHMSDERVTDVFI